MPRFSLLRICVLLWSVSWIALAPAAEDRTFREASFEQGRLRYLNGVPVLEVQGTPAQMGRQKAALTGAVTKQVADYPQRLLRRFGMEGQWPKFVERARGLLPQFPAAHRAELTAFLEHASMDRDLGLVADAIIDLKGGAFACSSLVVEPGKSATKQPLFGRNLDFFVMDVLDKYGLVTAYRPAGKRAFVSIGYPGLSGALSGMNDAGLALAVHEVFLARDAAPRFNPKGVPCMLIFRRILEECSTVEEAEKLLRGSERATMFLLVLCDRRGGAVLEATPKTVALRRAANGLTLCTNDCRTRELGLFSMCRRYQTLSRASALETLALADVAKKLDEVSMSRMTVQSMIFEPSTLVLHLAMGAAPATKQPLRRLELAELLGK